METPATIHAFWFGPAADEDEDDVIIERQSALWWKKQPEVDAAIRARFAPLVGRAAVGELDAWLGGLRGRLALILLTDQFPRNIWRGTPRAFACDAEARRVAANAIAAGHDRAVPAEHRLFFYLPFEHSEDLADQERSLALMRGLDDRDQLHWAERHHAVIARFGRFPHRNAILGRQSSAEESEFLCRPGSSF